MPMRRAVALVCCNGPASWAKTSQPSRRDGQRRRGNERFQAICAIRDLTGPIMEIIDEVRQVIAKSLKVPLEQLAPDTRLEDIGAESLDVIEIVFELEEKFGINIPFQANEGARLRPPGEKVAPAQLEFQTIGEVAKAVKALVDAKAAS